MRAKDFLQENPALNPESAPMTEPGNGIWNPENDRIRKRDWKDTRKNRITLKQLHKLRQMRAVRMNDFGRRKKQLTAQYGRQGPEDMGGAGGLGGGAF